MKIAVIGNGKTGSEVVKLLSEPTIYDIDNPVKVSELQQADAAIIFVPGTAVAEILPIVMEAKIPAIWGSTGFDWPKNIDQQLQQQQSKWVIAANFSLSMHLVRHCLNELKLAKKLLDTPKFHIEETHHTHKKDAPSGTAIAWQQWLDIACDIHSKREGDIKGIHKLMLQTADETITLQHEVHNRAIFAKGAIWAANYLVNNIQKPGLYSFAALVDKYIIEQKHATN